MIRRAVLIVLAWGVAFAATACGSTPKNEHERRAARYGATYDEDPTSGQRWGSPRSDPHAWIVEHDR